MHKIDELARSIGRCLSWRLKEEVNLSRHVVELRNVTGSGSYSFWGSVIAAGSVLEALCFTTSIFTCSLKGGMTGHSYTDYDN